MKSTKKVLRRRAKMCYTGAIVLGITSLLVASGVETAATFGGIIGLFSGGCGRVCAGAALCGLCTLAGNGG